MHHNKYRFILYSYDNYAYENYLQFTHGGRLLRAGCTITICCYVTLCDTMLW